MLLATACHKAHAKAAAPVLTSPPIPSWLVTVSVSVGGSTSGSLGVSASGTSSGFSTTQPTMVMNYIIGI